MKKLGHLLERHDRKVTIDVSITGLEIGLLNIFKIIGTKSFWHISVLKKARVWFLTSV